jgi:hypothetical protein
MSAKGVFEVTHDVSDLTFADFLSEVGLLDGPAMSISDLRTWGGTV